MCSDHPTVEVPSTVFYSEASIRDRVGRLRAKGCRLGANFAGGRDVLGGYIDVPPYRNEPHLKLYIGGFVTTSVGIIAVR